MAIPVNMYWHGRGKYQAYSDQLAALVPARGEAECKHIDRFRRAGNAYYDIYNNGGCNSVIHKVGYFFRGVMPIINECHRYFGGKIDWEAVALITEPAMDALIEKIAKKLGPINGVNLND